MFSYKSYTFNNLKIPAFALSKHIFYLYQIETSVQLLSLFVSLLEYLFVLTEVGPGNISNSFYIFQF